MITAIVTATQVAQRSRQPGPRRTAMASAPSGHATRQLAKAPVPTSIATTPPDQAGHDGAAVDSTTNAMDTAAAPATTAICQPCNRFSHCVAVPTNVPIAATATSVAPGLASAARLTTAT